MCRLHRFWRIVINGRPIKKEEKENPSRSISAPQAFLIHLICGLGLAISLWVSHNFYSINLVSHPSITLSHLGTLQKSLSLVDFEAIVPNCFLVFFFFFVDLFRLSRMQLSYFICSHFRIDPQQCSVLPCHSLLFMCSGFFSLSWKCGKVKFFLSQFSWKPNKPKLLDLFTCFSQFVFSGCFGCTNWYLVLCVLLVDSFVYFFPYRLMIFLPFL